MLQTVLHQQKSLDAYQRKMCRPALALKTVSIAFRGDSNRNPVIADPLVNPAPPEVDPGAMAAAIVIDSEIGK